MPSMCPTSLLPKKFDGLWGEVPADGHKVNAKPMIADQKITTHGRTLALSSVQHLDPDQSAAGRNASA